MKNLHYQLWMTVLSGWILFGSTVKAQTTYVDVITPVIMDVYAGIIQNEQEDTQDKMDKLKQAQASVAAGMVVANDIQNKVFKGLSEVNGTLSNGLQIQRIYFNMTKSSQTLNQIWDLTTDNPEYGIFAVKSAQMLSDQMIRVYTDAADILQGGTLNLATSGDRRILLANIENNTRKIYMTLLSMRYSIELAKYKGFWKAINPFQGYINTDKAIYRDILSRVGQF